MTDLSQVPHRFGVSGSLLSIQGYLGHRRGAIYSHVVFFTLPTLQVERPFHSVTASDRHDKALFI